MATQLPLFTLPGFEAGADMTDDQFKFVTISEAEKVETVSVAGDTPLGVLQNAPKAGESAQIMQAGITKVIAGSGDISAGEYVVMNSDGTAEDAGTTASEEVVGIGIDGADDGNIASILLFGAVIERDLS